MIAVLVQILLFSNIYIPARKKTKQNKKPIKNNNKKSVKNIRKKIRFVWKTEPSLPGGGKGGLKKGFSAKLVCIKLRPEAK